MPAIANDSTDSADPHAVHDCDVAVIGGGPAGSTTASLLARQGHRVVLFEKTRFPRFHIGESLLPANMRLFDRLGVRERIEAVSMRKNGIELVSPLDGSSTLLEFAECWDKTMPYAVQVRRSEFDRILLERAGELGAQVLQNTRVTRLDLGADDGPSTLVARTLTDDGVERETHWRARFVVDATGRDTLISTRLGLKRKNPDHNSTAIYAHYSNARRLEGDQEGNISLFWFEHGWYWFIPLADGTTSVGAVCWPYYLKSRDKDLDAFFADTLAMSPPLAQRLEGATRINDVTATGNFSYGAQRSHGRNWLLVGDAYAFIDPVFSSGVFLAMNSGFAGAEAVDTCLREPARAPAALRRFHRTMRKGPREFSWFIYRITRPTLRGIFLAPRNPLRVKEALLSLLAGDIFGRTPIWPSLWLFKGIYYAACMFNLPRTLRETRRRREVIRDVGLDLN